MIKQEQLLPLGIALFLGLILGTGGLALTNRVQPAPILIEAPLPTATPAPTATPGPIRVFVSGAVEAPAVYALPADAILQDAIEAAGGFSDEANRDVVNLAQPLGDGMHVLVPTQAQVETAVLPLLPIVSEPETISEAKQAQDGLININTATLEELDTLPGIGISTAQKIIDFRESSGLFLSIEDIMLVPGIGEGKFEQIKDAITADVE